MSLRTALKLDAVVTGANGAAYLVAAGPLEDLLGLSPALLRGIGAFLLLFSAAVWTVASRPQVSASAALAVIAVNVLWAADSIAFLLSGLSDPTTAGADLDRDAGARRRGLRRPAGRHPRRRPRAGARGLSRGGRDPQDAWMTVLGVEAARGLAQRLSGVGGEAAHELSRRQLLGQRVGLARPQVEAAGVALSRAAARNGAVR